MMSPTVGNMPLRADYRVLWFPQQPVSGQPTNLGMVQEDFSFAAPLWQDCTDEWSVSAKVRSELFQTHAILPNTRQEFPEELWNINVGTTYRHQFDNGWIAGGSVHVGSASDRPFGSFDELTAGVNAFLRIPSGEHNAWLFTLSYSTTSELPVPLPGVAYIWQPTDWFHANIGLPFQVWVRPLDDLTLDFSYMLLTTIHARATYRVSPCLRVYAGFDWENESYFLYNRPNENDRFWYYDKRLTTGVKAILSRNVSLDLSGGYAFDRFYFEGARYSDRNFNRVDVGDGGFVSFQCHIRW
jgi:hypothetical protein